MENKKHIESLGFVIKKEKLSNLASDYKFSELLLEDLDPFPGFYDHFHIPMNEQEQKPRSIFAIVKSMSLDDMDDFIRITMKIKDRFPHKFDAVMGRLELQNNQVACIRINMDNYTVLPDLVSLYSKYGIVFLANKVVKPYVSLINVRKYLSIRAIAPNIYQDEDMPDTYYFPVDKFLSWNKFEAITISIRNNFDHKVYDAAQAGIYCKKGVVELVRIYDRKATIEHLTYLQDKYEIEVARAL
ncbi:MAG: hypothetical protein V1775_04685 [Bacteroidota bacterium]